MAKRKYKNWLKAYIEYTENSEAPYLFQFWSGIFSIAAALERKVWLKWDRVLYPNFYIVLVGPSGVRKGTAMYPAERLLKAADINFVAESITREALIREMKKSAKTTTNPENGEVMESSAVSVFSKEFTVFLGYNNNQLIMDLTDFYDCSDRWEYKTKTQGEDTINGVWLNLIGATTPSQLQTSLPLNAIGGGLSSRMIFVFEDKKAKIVPFPSGIRWENRSEDGVISLRNEMEEDLINDLLLMRQVVGEFTFSMKFRSAWEKWYINNEENPRYTSTFLEPFETRRATHVLKLCMILNINRNGNLLITEEDLEQAIGIMDETEKKMPYTFRGVGESEDSYILGKVLNNLLITRETTFNELLGVLINDTTEVQLARVLATLERVGTIYTENIDNDKNVKIKLIKEV